MVQHVADDASSVRLCSVDVDRAAGGDRTHVRTLRSHRSGAVVRHLLPHPSLPLVASIDSAGELMLWECALLPAAAPAPAAGGAAPLARGSRSIAEAAKDVEQGAPRWLVRVAGDHCTAVWPLEAAAQLLVVQGDQLEVVRRARAGAGARGTPLVWE
eukprot:197166-Prymnesium_polylepis.1